MPDPNPLDPLTRYREIERAARKTRAAQQFGTSESVLQSLYALQCAYESTPDPDIALVRVRKFRRNGKPSCYEGIDSDTECPFWQESSAHKIFCSGIHGNPEVTMGDPHPDCPVWKEEGK